VLFAHAQGGYIWGGPFEPWEIHPALNHLLIAFLLGGVAVDLYDQQITQTGYVCPVTGETLPCETCCQLSK
jgi:hypothetical protein